MPFEKLTPIEGGIGGCACCGSIHEHLPMTSIIAVGFGDARVEKNGKPIYSEMWLEDEDKIWTVQDAEDVASLNPDNDWRIHFNGPLSDKHYQRQGDGLWVLYKKGMGFA